MKQTTYLYMLYSLVIMSFFACSKEKERPLLQQKTLGVNQHPSSDSTGLRGIYVLSSDQAIQLSGSIAYYDFTTGTFDRNYFANVNGYNLGIFPMDMQRYGSRIYVTVRGAEGWHASFLEVLDANTLVSQARIPFFQNGVAYLPTNLAFDNGKVFVSCGDGYIRRVDTTSLTIDGSVFVGGEPLQIAEAGHKLFVTGYPDQNGPPDTFHLPIIDLPSFTTDTVLTFLDQPIAARKGNDGNMYIHFIRYNIYRPNSFIKIDPLTAAITDLGYGAYVFDMDTRGDSLWMIEPYYRSLTIYNTSTGAWSGIIPTAPFDRRYTPSAIGVNQYNGDFAILDSQEWAWDDAKFYYFDHNGNMLFTYVIDKSPMEVVFLYK